jgi:hypothetical protein
MATFSCFSSECDQPTLNTINPDKQELFTSFVELDDCIKKYGEQACEHQARSIQNCINIAPHVPVKEHEQKCRIGMRISENTSISIGDISIEALEKKLFNPEVLSKILATEVNGQKGTYLSNKKIPAFPMITNHIKIKKIKPGRYQIISQNYSHALVYSNIDLVLKDNQIFIRSNTFVKQSTADISLAKQTIKYQIHQSFKRLEREVNNG